MLSLLIAGLMTAPQWTTQLELDPPPLADLELSAEGAPRDIVVLPPRRAATLVVRGPGMLRVQAWGLMRETGARVAETGKLRVWVDTVQRKTMELTNEPAAGWHVVGKPRWRVGRGQQVEFPLSAGEHRVSLQHQLRRGSLGYGLLVEVIPREASATEETPAARDTAAGAGAAPLEPPPPPPAPPPSPPPVVEPLIDASPARERAQGLQAAPAALAAPAPGLEIVEAGGQHAVGGPDGVHDFYQISIEPGMLLTTTGPGTIVLDVHVHRYEHSPETLEPLVLGFLLDDVLVKTVSLATPATDEFSAHGAPYGLSGRVAVRVAVPVGEHRLQLSLSDNAVLGASVRPRFLALGAEGPDALGMGSAHADDLAADGAQGGAVLGVMGGLWNPTALPDLGVGATIEGGMVIPVHSTRLLLHLSATLGYTEASRQIEDANTAEGESRVWVQQTTVPIIAGATWHAPMPIAGLSFELGLGGGAVLNQTQVRYRRVDADPGIGVALALSAWAGAGMEVGPGTVLVRATVVTAVPYSDETLKEFDPGALQFGSGYRLQFDL